MKRTCAFFVLVAMLVFSCAGAEAIRSNDGYVIYDCNAEYDHDFALEQVIGEVYDVVLQPEDLTEDWLCVAVAEITKQGLNTDDGEYVESVILENRDLQINVILPPEAYQLDEKGFYAETRASSITDELLGYLELDKYWDTMTITMEIDTTYIVRFGKEDIDSNEYGRFLNYDKILEEIWE